MKARGLPLVASLFVLLAVRPVAASDHNNLDEGLPLAVEDAYPIEYYGRELQAAFSYERTHDGRDLFVLEPRLEVGFAPNWQGTLIVPTELGSAVPDGLGQVGLGALYNFNTEGIWLPAFAVSGRTDFPTEKGSRGVDTTAKLLVTKSIGATSLFHQLHLNAAWIHNARPRPDEREHRYRLVLGWSVRLGADTIGILDYVREQEVERTTVRDMIELGLRRQISPLLTLSIGAGAGLTDESPDVRVVAGLQYSL